MKLIALITILLTTLPITSHNRYFPRLNNQQQALVYDYIPTCIGIAIPQSKKASVKITFCIGLIGYSWFVQEYWGKYHRIPTSEIYQQALVGSIVGCVIAAIRRSQEDKELASINTDDSKKQ